MGSFPNFLSHLKQTLKGVLDVYFFKIADIIKHPNILRSFPPFSIHRIGRVELFDIDCEGWVIIRGCDSTGLHVDSYAVTIPPNLFLVVHLKMNRQKAFNVYKGTINDYDY
jgi:hypothetical protein